MSFKENLQAKITIDHLARKVTESLKPSDGIISLDRDAMRSLLAMGGWRRHLERDLELYLEVSTSGLPRILVLDNELPVYRTGIRDVALRKSPTIKEMLNIRNAVKILNDRDVKISTGEQTVQSVCRESIARLDLTWTPSDIDQIVLEGMAALDGKDGRGVREALSLFVEMLSYAPLPISASLSAFVVYGGLHKFSGGKGFVGPVIAYNFSDHRLTLRDGPFEVREGDRLDKMLTDDQTITLEGAPVFRRLQADVMATGDRSAILNR